MSARLAEISTFSQFNEIFAVPMSIQQPDLFASKCEVRPGIGLCDSCGLPKWPQTYEGYGSMICADCRAKEQAERTARKSTSTLALESVDAKALASLCLSALKQYGPMTADETARNLGLSVLSIRPRITELSKAGLIVKTGVRRANVSGCNANEWRAV